MKLFENAFRDKYTYYERYFNTETNKSEIQSIDPKFEYYVPFSSGDYKLITDKTLNVTKLEGTSKQAREQMGVTNPIYKHIRDAYWREGNYNLKPRIMYLDIETRALGAPDPKNAPEQIILIQMLDTGTDQVIVLGLRDWEPEEDYKLEYPVKYVKCKDEVELLGTFVKVFQAVDPVLIYAWNGEGFDYPYIYNRMKRLGLDPANISKYGEVRLYSDEEIFKGSKNNSNGNSRGTFRFSANGYYFMDAMEVYKRYVLSPRPSYSLDSIAKIEVRSNKVEHTEFPTFDSFYTGENYNISKEPYKERIREQIRQCFIKQSKLTKGTKEYEDNHNELMKNIHFQFVYYGVMDVILLRKIDEKRNLSKIITNIAKTMGVLFNDVLGTVKPWGQYISNIAHDEHLVMPKFEEHSGEQYEGAYVRDPVKGKHKWVMNFDVNSMYPQYSIAGFGMSPENLVPIAKLPPELRELILVHFVGKTDEEIMGISEEVWDKVTPILKKHNLSLTANGVCYSKDSVGIIPRLVNQIYDGRKLDKKKMFKYEQQSVNIEEVLAKRPDASVNPGVFKGDLKDPLDYSIEELNNLSTPELKKLNLISIDMKDKYNTEQLTKKILINALYGATGNQFFPLYNRDFASGITANGRMFIKQTANMLREKFQELIPWDQEYIIYGDTDSSVFNTLINTDKGDIKIGDIYNSTESKEIEYKPGKFFKEVNGVKALSVSKDFKLEYKPIKYVMKHKVKKRLFKIKCNGNEVVITNDHSIMVKRDGKLIEVKPFEIKKTDKLILVKEIEDA